MKQNTKLKIEKQKKIRSIIYFRCGPTDSISDSSHISLRTRRDFHPLVKELLKVLGKPDTISTAFDPKERKDGIADYIWFDKTIADQTPPEIKLSISRGGIEFDEYEIKIASFNKIGNEIKLSSAAKKTLIDLIQKHLFTQKEILTPKVADGYTVTYSLDELFSINELKTYERLKKAIQKSHGPVTMNYGISPKGDIGNMYFNGSWQEAPPDIDSFINEFAYPYVVRIPEMDTIGYFVNWEEKIPNSVYKQVLLDSLSHWPKNDKLPKEPLNIDFLELYGPLYIGHLFSETKIHALLQLPNDSFFYVYEYNGSQWKELARYEGPGNLGEMLRLEDLNGDKIPEIISETSPNMNGNKWMKVYVYSKEKNSFEFAGDLTSGYTVKPERKEIWVEYYGSWYMTQEKSIYYWYGNTLIKVKYATMEPSGKMNDDTEEFSYYENPGWKKGKDDLTLKLKGQYLHAGVYNKNLKPYWENFFK